jgi:hypothetical protein
MFEKKRLAERPPPQKVILGLILAISLVIVGFAERDLQGRPEEQIRGSRFVWRLASLNAVGALAYLGLGRRRAGAPPPARPR